MSQAAPVSESGESRTREDRRTFSWRTVLYGFLRSRRREHRRIDEGEPLFTDWHHPWLFFLAVGTMVLSCLDAVMTLELIRHGAQEANPFMASVMGISTAAFAGSKMLLTAMGILALVFMSRAPFMTHFRTGMLLTIVFSMYACLICYEFVHLMRMA